MIRKTRKATRTTGLVLAFATIAAAMALPATAGTVENLERERAILIDTFLNPEMTPAERQTRIATSKFRLLDLERMVLRDDGLVGRATPAVKRAFANYDLTFLVHASAEKDMSVTDNWLTQMDITTQAIMSASRRRR